MAKEPITLARMDSKTGGPAPMSEAEIREAQEARANLEAWRDFQRRCPEHKWVD